MPEFAIACDETARPVLSVGADRLLSSCRRWLRRHRERRQLVALSRRDPRLLRDIGLDPERIYEALDGTWDEVGPAHLSRLLPRCEKV